MFHSCHPNPPFMLCPTAIDSLQHHRSKNTTQFSLPSLPPQISFHFLLTENVFSPGARFISGRSRRRWWWRWNPDSTQLQYHSSSFSNLSLCSCLFEESGLFSFLLFPSFSFPLSLSPVMELPGVHGNGVEILLGCGAYLEKER